MNGKKVLVTGASGHIGSMLCRALLERGREVVAFVRPTSSRVALDGMDVETAVGDVLDRARLAEAAKGCDVVFHNAAVFELAARDPEALRRIAIEGSRNVIAAAASAGARVVLTGSVAAVGFSDGPGDLLDERSWASHLTAPYYVAKQDAERAATSAAEELGVELVSVLPTIVLGPGDHRITPSSRVLVDMLLGTGATFEGGGNVIDVRDAADAMIAAGERGRPGARYILGGENVLIRDLGAIVARITGRPVRHLSLPRWAMHCMAGGAELGAALTGKTPPVTRAVVRDAYGRYAWYDVTSARRELGLSTRPVEDTLLDAARFFQTIGVVPKHATQAVDALAAGRA